MALRAQPGHGVGLILAEWPVEEGECCGDEGWVKGPARVGDGLEMVGEFGLESQEPTGRPLLLPPDLGVSGGSVDDNEFPMGEHDVGEPFEHGRVGVFAEHLGDSVLDFMAGDASVAFRQPMSNA